MSRSISPANGGDWTDDYYRHIYCFHNRNGDDDTIDSCLFKIQQCHIGESVTVQVKLGKNRSWHSVRFPCKSVLKLLPSSSFFEGKVMLLSLYEDRSVRMTVPSKDGEAPSAKPLNPLHELVFPELSPPSKETLAEIQAHEKQQAATEESFLTKAFKKRDTTRNVAS